MSNFRRNVLCAAAVCALGLGSGCTGFFVNPTLTSLAIGPQNQTITVNPPQTIQMAATGTYSDGSQQDLTGKVLWSSSTTTCATINKSGLVTPAASVSGGVCETTISASSGTVAAATTTVTVTQGTPTTITLTASTTGPNVGGSVTFTAMATFPGVSGPQDITSSVTWINSNTTDLTLTQGSGVGTISAGAAVGTVISVQASFDGVVSNVIQLTLQ